MRGTLGDVLGSYTTQITDWNKDVGERIPAALKNKNSQGLPIEPNGSVVGSIVVLTKDKPSKCESSVKDLPVKEFTSSKKPNARRVYEWKHVFPHAATIRDKKTFQKVRQTA